MNMRPELITTLKYAELLNSFFKSALLVEKKNKKQKVRKRRTMVNLKGMKVLGKMPLT